MKWISIVLFLLASVASAEAAPIALTTKAPIQELAVREVLRCIESGGAEHFTMENGEPAGQPPGVEIPDGAKVTFSRVPTDQGVLYIYSGWRGRTNFCGIAVFGVDSHLIGDVLARTLSAQEGWTLAERTGGWDNAHTLQSQYWGDRHNTDLHGAVLMINKPSSALPAVQVDFHSTGVI